MSRQPGEPAPLPDGPVWTGLRDRKGQSGRFHTSPDCWALLARLTSRSKHRVRRWEQPGEARAMEWYPCPFCAERPTCCTTGTHAAIALPRLEAPELPDWERELLLEEQGSYVLDDD